MLFCSQFIDNKILFELNGTILQCLLKWYKYMEFCSNRTLGWCHLHQYFLRFDSKWSWLRSSAIAWYLRPYQLNRDWDILSVFQISIFITQLCEHGIGIKKGYKGSFTYHEETVLTQLFCGCVFYPDLKMLWNCYYIFSGLPNCAICLSADAVNSRRS